MGWWRRNRWGLVALVPAAAGILALSAESLYYGVYSGEPRVPVSADADGRYALANARVRLLDAGQATDLETYAGDPFTPPPNVTIWRARIEFTADPEDHFGGCTMSMEDDSGRSYLDGATAELTGAADTVSAGCLAPYEAKGMTTYVNTVYFALPSDAHAVAIRISLLTGLPRYIRLPMP